MDRTRRNILIGITTMPLLSLARYGWAAGLPTISVSKDPSCGCCTSWIKHVRAAGFPVTVNNTSELDQVKVRLGVPTELASCHTAEVGPYVVEGHVPATAIRRLLEEKPQAIGVAVPGMPAGAPGMEAAGAPLEDYEVVLFGPGMRQPYARFRGTTETAR